MEDQVSHPKRVRQYYICSYFGMSLCSRWKDM